MITATAIAFGVYAVHRALKDTEYKNSEVDHREYIPVGVPSLTEVPTKVYYRVTQITEFKQRYYLHVLIHGGWRVCGQYNTRHEAEIGSRFWECEQ
jgi:hypothetical protein